jgi:endonuclease III
MFKIMVERAAEMEEEEFKGLEDSIREMSFLKANSDRVNATCKTIIEELSQNARALQTCDSAILAQNAA